MKFQFFGAMMILASLMAIGCGNRYGNTPNVDTSLTGAVRIDGSSTVYPIAEAVAEEFQKMYPNVKVTVGASGTGGGFKKFIAGETDISDASRPIKKSEQNECKEKKVEYIELPVAYDGIAVCVHKNNTWCEEMTTAELKTMWEEAAHGKIMKWSQIRPNWPDKEIKLFGPGTDSGTFEYFTEAINGKAKSSRADYTPSEDDNVLVTGIAGDEYALGYFGLAYFVNNQDKIKAVKINDGNDENGKGGIMPSDETVKNGTYQPLSRPVFVYVKVSSLDRPEIAKFVEFFLDQAPILVPEVHYVVLPGNSYELAKKRVADRKTGTVFGGAGATIGVKIEELLTMEGQ